jgi:hypothetical protein
MKRYEDLRLAGYVHEVTIDYEDESRAAGAKWWLRANLERSEYHIAGLRKHWTVDYLFKNERDAVLFKMKWG